MWVVVQPPPLGFEREKCGEIQSVRVGDRAACVASSDKHRPFLGETPGGVFSNRAETLNDDPGSGQR